MNQVAMFPGGNDQRVDDGVHPQRGLLEFSSRSARFAELVGEGEIHLVAVLVPKRRRVAVQQRSVDGPRVHHVPRTRPVARACFSREFNRSTSAAATCRPKRRSR